MSERRLQTRRIARPVVNPDESIEISPASVQSSSDIQPPSTIEVDRTTERNVALLARDVMQRGVLTVLTGINAGQVFSLDAETQVLGRAPEADIWLEDPGISRAHAKITRKEQGYFVVDLGSTNGTFIRKERVESSPLVTGDRIQLGPNMLLSFALVDDAEEELRHRLYEASTRDSLTRAFNRQFLVERLSTEVAHARRHQTKLAVLMLDLDGFKRLNDTFGHLAGDMVLRAVASQLARLIRTEDMLARYGGEEFVIVARSTGKTHGTRLAERVRSAIERLPIELHDETLHVTCSVGVAALSELAADSTPDDLLRLADARLYDAKERGRNQVVNS